ncbi:MAG: hypothetical protein ACSHYA_07715 [Opitutaceae bacterium]
MHLNYSTNEKAFSLREASKLNGQVEELYNEVLNDGHLSIHHKAHIMEILKSTYDALAQEKYADAGEYLSDLSVFAEHALGEDVQKQKLVQHLWKIGRYIARIGDSPNLEPVAG